MTRKLGIIIIVTGIVFIYASACQKKSESIDNFDVTSSMIKATATDTGVFSNDLPELSELYLMSEDELLPYISVEVKGLTTGIVNAQNPAILDIEIAGRDIDEVYRTVYLRLDDGQSQQIERSLLQSARTDESSPKWPDGVYKFKLVWDAKAGYLTDGLNGEYACMKDRDEFADYVGSRYYIAGGYRPHNGKSFSDVELVIDTDNGKTSILTLGDNPAVTFPQPGDEFRPLRCFILDDELSIKGSEISLFFDENSRLTYDERPLTSGEYTVTIEVVTLEGHHASSSSVFVVSDFGLIPGFQAYVDTQLGYQFLFPASWPDPMVEENRVVFGDGDFGINLSVTTHPDAIGQSVEQLQSFALSVFGPVQVLYEDRIEVASTVGIRTVYRYESPISPRIGAFLAFINSDAGYIADIDGPESNVDMMMEIIRMVSDTWTNREMILSDIGDGWTSFIVDGLTVAIPSGYRRQENERGWTRFVSAEERAMLAIRTDIPGNNTQEAALRSEVLDYNQGKPNFRASEASVYELSGKEWLRVDYTYRGFDGSTRYGLIMMTAISDQPVVILVEASLLDFKRVANSEFMLVAADIEQE